MASEKIESILEACQEAVHSWRRPNWPKRSREVRRDRRCCDDGRAWDGAAEPVEEDLFPVRFWPPQQSIKIRSSRSSADLSLGLRKPKTGRWRSQTGQGRRLQGRSREIKKKRVESAPLSKSSKNGLYPEPLPALGGRGETALQSHSQRFDRCRQKPSGPPRPSAPDPSMVSGSAPSRPVPEIGGCGW